MPLYDFEMKPKTAEQRLAKRARSIEGRLQKNLPSEERERAQQRLNKVNQQLVDLLKEKAVQQKEGEHED
jgi:hypothetical protein